MTDAEKGHIERINQVSAMARTSWIALLGFLAFIGVTLLSVTDVDFFTPTRTVQLPLINVAIPTDLFFAFAPVLAAALYVYLHIILLKLWDAIADVESPNVDGQPFGDVINPWLVNDWALCNKGGAFTPARPLRALGNLASFLLVWAAAPLLLFGFWYRSMPAHKPLLTLLLAASFLVAFDAGVTSWRTAKAWLSGARDTGPDNPWLWRLGAFIGRLRGWRPIGRRASRAPGSARRGRWDSACLGVALVCVSLLTTAWPFESGRYSTLFPANLVDAELVVLPPDWRTPETARAAFRETWCRREGLDMETCGQPATSDAPIPAWISADRANWCGGYRKLSDDECRERFSDLDRRFAVAWNEERESAIANLPSLNFVARDLRGARAFNATLVGADLNLARMEGANLREARMEGANLSFARMERANLSFARMEGANLRGARMEGANLSFARMEGANLREARMEGADLRGARMEGANLSFARMEGADLRGARMEGANLFGARMEGANLSFARMERANLREARMEGADLSLARMERANLSGANFRSAKWAGASNRASPAHFADLRGAQDLTQAQLDELIGNGQTLLPEGDAPDSRELYYIWNCWEIPPEGFDDLLRRWAGSENWSDQRAIRDASLCGREPRQKLYNGLSLEAPYPPGHPLAELGN